MTLTLRSPLEERIAINSKTANGHTNGVTPTESGVQVVIDGEDLDIALQYGPSAGLGKLRHLMEDLQSQIHHREKAKEQSGAEWAVSFGSGTQDLMYKVSFLPC
jgi:tryptophan aminotransferase